MVKSLSEIYRFACSICHKEFSNVSRADAEVMAQRCESKGTPKIHRLHVENTVSYLHENRAGTGKVIRLWFEEATHVPFYTLRLLGEFSNDIEVPATSTGARVSGVIVKPLK